MQLSDDEMKREIEQDWSLPPELKSTASPGAQQRPEVSSTDWLDALIEEYQARWKATMPQKGKESEQAVLHGMHFEVGNMLKRLKHIKKRI